ncbi:MAG: MoxR family ATPase [Fibrobacter sp.]|nr:MoxR family ATPase [Fibrobacter sp.]
MIESLISSLNNVLFGKGETVDLLVMALLADGHVLVEDVPGTGKTTLSKALAAAIGADFARIQFTPDLLPADVTGGTIYKANTGEFEVRKGPVFTQVLLADEINRASPRTQSALLEAMEERQVTLDGECFRLPELFMVLATENPVEFHGVFPLPEAQMDRFMIRISVGYPDVETELKILRSQRKTRPIDEVNAVTSPAAILELRTKVRDVHIDESLEKYIVDLVQATRSHAGVRLAASPRAGLNLVRMSQASAIISGRDFVSPDDIQRVFFAVMEHRVFAKDTASPNASQKILQTVLESVAVPK